MGQRPAVALTPLKGVLLVNLLSFFGKAVIAQLVARRSHNPKVVSSILTDRIFLSNGRSEFQTVKSTSRHG